MKVLDGVQCEIQTEITDAVVCEWTVRRYTSTAYAKDSNCFTNRDGKKIQHLEDITEIGLNDGLVMKNMRGDVSNDA